MTKIISCEAHDYFEIVCMRRSNLKLTLLDHRTVEGIAKDIMRKSGHEYLVIETKVGDEEVDLTEIKTLEAMHNSVAQHNFNIVL